jgi:valyl-tRNA synthetase
MEKEFLKKFIIKHCSFEELMKLLHPFMPFQSEEIWQTISERKLKSFSYCSAEKAEAFNEDIIKNFETASELFPS